MELQTLTMASISSSLVLLLLSVLLLPSISAKKPLKEKLSHLHFYFHDLVSGRNATAIPITPPLNASSLSFFGMVAIMDDLLTASPEPNSTVVGRAQGFYAAASQSEVGLFQAMNLLFTSGKYNGSVLTVLGRNAPFHSVRELPIVGGAGLFRFARGYALAHTHWLDLTSGDAIVEYNVYVLHY
ncbi:putative dirigent protein [Dioscorea sansibarensis]